ncbi:MAG TPA: hypothetical protein VGO82_05670, partial [Enterovirga sp.]|nr:hypothetical protein [Enterovirga sp.]
MSASAPQLGLAARLAAAPFAPDQPPDLPEEIAALCGRHGAGFTRLVQGIAAYSPFLWRLAQA